MNRESEPSYDLTKTLISCPDKDDGYFDYAAVVARRLDKNLHEQLLQIINGPIWDGDIICKSYREKLFDLGLVIRVCYKGEQGFTGATYFAYSVMKVAGEIKRGARG